MSQATDVLIAQLSSGRAVLRDAAIARLAVIGARVVDPLIQLASSAATSPTVRVSALRTLERIGDRRALAPALGLAADPDAEIAVAAIGVARVFVTGRHGVDAVDRLTAVAVDRTRPSVVRAAAVDALRQLGPSTIAPLLKQVADDPALRLSTPAAMRAAIQAGATGPLPALVKFVDEVRARERAAPEDERAEWTAVRGNVHAVIAARGSTIALYDLRETIERTAEPLPADFIAALTGVGDATCLEPIAAAYARATNVRWKKSLADAFRTIAKRDRITRRHATMKKALKRAPDLVSTL